MKKNISIISNNFDEIEIFKVGRKKTKI